MADLLIRTFSSPVRMLKELRAEYEEEEFDLLGLDLGDEKDEDIPGYDGNGGICYLGDEPLMFTRRRWPR